MTTMVDPRDRTAMGDPETVILLPGEGALIGLYIRGVPGQTMLGIREDADGQPVSCAVGISLDLPIQSNPRRHDEDDAV